MFSKKTILSIAIALILALFIGYGIEVFDAAPDQPRDAFFTQEECEQAGFSWQETPKRAVEDLETGYCDTYEKYSQEAAKHNKVVFIVSIIAGLIAIILGIVLKMDAVSTGILAGGVLIILYGTIRYWQLASNILKFILLGIALAVLLWLGYKKLK
ncbi:hypothetical protein COV20_05615 [Candidatus Woesearchaeota archaeon CG10_big_fil_rev_8_21_14_0_10_45_16]|nr:MAG: hypothetical protein COV20_05615 [Candidatus Woesearchaeota archaeon CG10_big_fil_rev_8_21_14_0_10_45_16]